MKSFKAINEKAKKGGITVFGSGFFCNIPFGELASDYELECPIYNRSIENLSIKNARTMLDDCVFSLSPSKVFVALGEDDCADNSISVEDFTERYSWLLYTMHSTIKSRIYIVSIMSESAKARRMNDALKKLSTRFGVPFIDCRSALHATDAETKTFDILRFYMRTRPISFSRAFAI